ncbi:hypothetical protein D3C74_261440 [compost metagenome]
MRRFIPFWYCRQVDHFALIGTVCRKQSVPLHEQQRRTTIRQHVPNPLRWIGWINRQIDSSRLDDRQNRHDHFQ